MTNERETFWERAGQDWWVAVVSATEYRCAPEWRVLPRAIDDYMLWYVRGGVASLTLAGREYPLVPGDVLLVPPRVRHSAIHDPARPLWTVTTHFTFRDHAGKHVHPPADDLLPVRCATREPHVFDAYFARLLTLEAMRAPGWKAVGRSLLQVVLAELHREHIRAAVAPITGHHDGLTIAQALLRLELEGTDFPTPGSLARACGFSPAYFSRLFRHQFGCTPQQYLLARRIERARQLLLESDLSVKQVAHSLGYRDVFFFTRQFTAHVGQPPAAFRRAARSPHDGPEL
jgi:AraC-like DNA-binding protein